MSSFLPPFSGDCELLDVDVVDVVESGQVAVTTHVAAPMRRLAVRI
jgi:hypothetical protein